MTGQPLSESRYAEINQMLAASSDAYVAGVWCALANELRDEIDRLRAEVATWRGVADDYRTMIEYRKAEVARLEAALALANENIRLRETSQIPMIPRGAQEKIERLEEAGDRLAEFLDEAADAWPRENKYDVPLHEWRALRGGGKERYVWPGIADELMAEIDRLRAERDHWREEAMHARDWAAKYQEACAEVARLEKLTDSSWTLSALASAERDVEGLKAKVTRLEAALALILQNRSGDAHAIAREALRGGGQEQPR